MKTPFSRGDDPEIEFFDMDEMIVFLSDGRTLQVAAFLDEDGDHAEEVEEIRTIIAAAEGEEGWYEIEVLEPLVRATLH